MIEPDSIAGSARELLLLCVDVCAIAKSGHAKLAWTMMAKIQTQGSFKSFPYVGPGDSSITLACGWTLTPATSALSLPRFIALSPSRKAQRYVGPTQQLSIQSAELANKRTVAARMIFMDVFILSSHFQIEEANRRCASKPGARLNDVVLDEPAGG